MDKLLDILKILIVSLKVVILDPFYTVFSSVCLCVFKSLLLNGVNTEDCVAVTVQGLQGCLRYSNDDVCICSSGLIGLCVSD